MSGLLRVAPTAGWKGYPLRKDYEFPLEYHTGFGADSKAATAPRGAVERSIEFEVRTEEMLVLQFGHGWRLWRSKHCR